MKRILLLVFFFAFASNSLAGEAYVKIPSKYQVENISLHGGYCAWACMETVGNFLGIEKLAGVMNNRIKDPDCKVLIKGQWQECSRNGGYDFCMQWKLDDLGIKYKMSRQGFYDRDIIKYGVKNKVPVVVAFKAAAFNGAHACILVGYDDENVVFIDPNEPGYTYKATRAWFDLYWDGFALIIEKE